MLGLFFATMFVIFLVGASFDAGQVRWDMLGLPAVILIGFLGFVGSRKTVQMDEECLYVSVFRRVVAIPLDQIAEVSEEIGMNANSRSVTVRFRNNTPFGRAIVFNPTFMLTREPHPIVEELLARARKAAAE